ncbi:hypothetical protein BH10ACI2_BH10ACI2_05350 [soil metagenome]
MEQIFSPSELERAKERRNEQGFTLIEIVVSMTIFMIVTGSIWGVLRIAQQSRSTVSQQVQLAKNVRLALNLMGRDAYNAGFGYPLKNTVLLPDNRISTLLGIPVDYDTTRDTVPPIIAGNQITTDTFNTVANTKTDQVTLVFKDSTFNVVSGVSTPIDVAVATTTGGGIDEVAPTSGSNATCRVNDIYLVTGSSGSTLGLSTALNGTTRVQFANSDLLGFNQTGTTGPLRSITASASMTRVRMVTYFVASDGTLTRREYANITPAVAYVDEPLVYGVDDFQIRYVMDDGTLTDNPSSGPDGVAGSADDVQSNLAAVRQIRFTVSVRSNELNSSGQPYRETMTSTFGTRNLGYDAN